MLSETVKLRQNHSASQSVCDVVKETVNLLVKKETTKKENVLVSLPVSQFLFHLHAHIGYSASYSFRYQSVSQ